MANNLFYGIEINNQGTKQAIMDAIALIKDVVPNATWTTAEKLHVTLAFLGDVPEGPASDRLMALERPSFKLLVMGAGTFASPGKDPRALWAGLLGGDMHLRSLHAALGGKGTFRPHLTLAKLETKGETSRKFTLLADQLKNTEFGTALISSVKLYRTVGKGQPYEVVADRALSGDAL